MKKKFLITKKVLATAMSAVMVLSMAACGNEEADNSSGASDTQQQNEQSSQVSVMAIL